MLLRTDVTGPKPVAQTDATTSITSITSASQETLNRLSLISVGKQFQAQIMSRLNDGTYLVKVADTTARMPLPGSPQAGDTITLTLLSANPRPTFVLGEQLPGAEEAIAKVLQNATTATQVSQTAAASADAKSGLVQEQLPSSATASLSQTGRFVDNLLHAAQLDGASTRILGQSAILSSPQLMAGGDTVALAQALQKTLEFSGLFYESHVAQWVEGERSLEALMREPQARVGNMPVNPVSFEPTKGQQTLIDVLHALETAQQATTQQQTNTSQTIPLNNETARLINLQLSTLENKRIEWQGELWPGQRFEWEVSEDTPRQTHEGEPESSWSSTVRFEMPTLGNIAASIHLNNGRVQMHIRTATDSVASTLRANGNALASAMEDAGSPLDLLTVNPHEPA